MLHVPALLVAFELVCGLDAEAIETWLKDVDDLNVHIDNGKEQVRITCE